MKKELPCFECETGMYRKVLKSVETADRNGNPLTVENVPHLCCPDCGDEVLNDKALNMITEARGLTEEDYRKPRRKPEPKRMKLPEYTKDRDPDFINEQDVYWWYDYNFSHMIQRPGIPEDIASRAHVWFAEFPEGDGSYAIVRDGKLEYNSPRIEDVALQIELLRTSWTD